MALIEALFNQTVTISRRDRIADGQGGYSILYADVGAVEGRLRPASSAERDVADQEQRAISHVLYVLHGTDIARGDQVEVDGLTLDVMGVREPSRAGYHLEVDCMEVQPETATAESGS